MAPLVGPGAREKLDVVDGARGPPYRPFFARKRGGENVPRMRT